MSLFKVSQSHGLAGEFTVPGDKSISHRSLMFGAIAHGKSHVRNFLNGADCLATAKIMKQLGVQIQFNGPTELTVFGLGLHGLKANGAVLDCENSGTTIRLMAGLMSGQSFACTLDGTQQIRGRPMGRVIEPLREMGAQITAEQNNLFAPIYIEPSSKLTGINYDLPFASAQVKSAMLLAGLYAEGTTVVIEPGSTRDHTERLLRAMGAQIQVDGQRVAISQQEKPLDPFDMTVPSDISSAAFLIVAGLIVPKSNIVLPQVNCNPTRTGILDAVKMMGANFQLRNKKSFLGEPVADIQVEFSDLRGTEFSGDHIVRMIDEIPVLAVLATQAQGTTTIKDAAELKVKETNRIETTVSELKKMGAKIEATEDGLVVEGPTPLTGTRVLSHGDHRLAMAMAIAGLVAEGQTVIEGAQVAGDSFPGFCDGLKKLGADILEEKA